MSKFNLPDCPHQQAAGSYYAPLPWSECHKDPQDEAGRLTGNWPMCAYDAGGTCDFYERLRRKDQE